MAGDPSGRMKLIQGCSHSKWILYWVAILSNNDIDEIILGIRSVQREPVATGLFPESSWYSEDRTEDDKLREELKQKSQLLRSKCIRCHSSEMTNMYF